MVAASDLKVYKTTGGLGGAITSTQVLTATPNNLFTNVPRNEQVVGEDYYQCVYFKNTHPTEAMESFKLWLSSKSFPHDTELKWAFDNTQATGYRWQPFKNFNGTSDFDIVNHTADLSLSRFSVSCWFNTNGGYVAFGILLTKGQVTDETLGGGTNYRISMLPDGTLQGGFEDTGGTDRWATTTTAFDDGQWHFVILTYDGVNILLHVDGVLEAGPLANQTPQTNTYNVAIGKSSNESLYFWNGQIDEVRVWNRALNSSERSALYTNNTVPTTGLLFERKYGSDQTINVAQTIADKYTAPTNVTWNSLGTEPFTPNKGTVGPTTAFPVWLWLHVDANATDRLDDTGRFSFKFTIPQGGTGGGGSGGGGEPIPDPTTLNLDQFGVNMLVPTATGGKEWFNKWANGNSREITTNDYDEDDPDLGISNATPFEIDGNGGGAFRSLAGSHRLYVNGPWTNTEMTVYVKVNTSCESIQLRARSNHHGVDNDPYGLESSSPVISCGFGGYNVNWGDAGDNIVRTQVEVIHDCYARHLDMHTWVIPPIGEYRGFKQITRTVNNNSVLVQGWFNENVNDQTDWVLQTEYLFDGTNVAPDETEPNVSTCIGQGDDIADDLVANSVWLNPSKWCWLRFNEADDVVLQKFSVREIPPITSGSGGGSGGGGGTPPPPSTDYKIAVAGDWGCEPETNDVIDLIQSEGYDYTIGVGDNAYESASCWTSRFTPLKPNFNSAYGNHEYSESGGTSPYKTFFGHSLTYFTFQYQNMFFFVLDTNINSDVGSNQYNFIKSEMERVVNDPTVTWRVLVNHDPWFGASSDHGYNSENQVQNYHQLAITNKVNFVCSGHNHNWQRTHQVRYNSSSATSPIVVDNTQPYESSAAGLIHVVSGTGGHDSGSSLYGLGSQPSYQAFQNRSHNGVWEMVASNNGQTLTCSFVDTSGQKYDTFVINA